MAVLSKEQKQVVIFILLLVGLLCSAFYYGYFQGQIANQHDCKDRALNLDANLDCYNQEDIEYIIFGESQL